MACVNMGPREPRMSRDGRGHRTYKIKFLVRCVNGDEGPALALATPGLPQSNEFWSYGPDVDVWAALRPEVTVDPVQDKQKVTHFILEFTYSTESPERCGSDVGNPLCEPAKAIGRYVRKTEEAVYAKRIDYYTGGDVVVRSEIGGKVPILNGAFEQIRGPTVEFPESELVVRVEMNRATLGLPLLESMKDTVNAAPLWGFPARCVRLTDMSWDPKYYGTMTAGNPIGTGTGTADCPDVSQCHKYYALTLEFECDSDGFDRDILDEATKALSGRFDGPTGNYLLVPVGGVAPDFLNPAHFVRFKDRNGENCRVLLDGRGLPADTRINTGTGAFTSDNVGRVRVEYYDESDFTLLGIPTTVE